MRIHVPIDNRDYIQDLISKGYVITSNKLKLVATKSIRAKPRSLKSYKLDYITLELN